jgi:DNA-binding beta-propeller fold protein YncE
VSADGTRQLATTIFTDSENRQNTTLTVTDTATGDPAGPALTVLGDAASSPARFLTADGSVALLTTAVYGYDPIGGGYVQGGFKTWVRVVDTSTGTVIGSAVVVRGMPFGSLITADGSRAVITTYYDNPTSHKTSTRIAVVDTVTGHQVGSTVAVSGQPSGTAPLAPGSAIIVSRTHLGLGAVIDSRSGSALTIPIAFPWGIDLSPLGPVIFVADLFLGVLVVAPVLAVLRIVEEGLHSIGVNIGRALTP